MVMLQPRYAPEGARLQIFKSLHAGSASSKMGFKKKKNGRGVLRAAYGAVKGT